MKMRILLAAIAVVALPLAACGERPQIERGQENSEADQQGSERENRPAAPAAVEAVAPTEDERNEPDARHDNNADQAPDIVQRITADPLMALLTFGLLFFAGWQTIISRNTARQELRAYISVKVASAIRDGLVFKAVIKFANVGQTPAKDVRTGAKILLVDKNRMSEVRRWEFEKKDGPPGVVWGPGLELAPLNAKRTLTNEEATKVIHDKTVNAVLVGGAEYVDVFGKKRTTNFSYVLDINSGEVTPHDYGGNDAT